MFEEAQIIFYMRDNIEKLSRFIFEKKNIKAYAMLVFVCLYNYCLALGISDFAVKCKRLASGSNT